MDKALTPYIQGGGAKRYASAVASNYGMDKAGAPGGGFQAMTQDMLTVLNDVPFTIPPYFALLARAMVTLEGIALVGNPDYAIVLETYPFIARKLLKEDRPEVQRALQEALYGARPGSGGELRGQRIASLLNSALGIIEKTGGGAVDLDKIPKSGVDAGTALRYLLTEDAKSLRELLEKEAVVAVDLVLRQTLRRALGSLNAAFEALTRPIPFASNFVVNPLDVPGPVPLPDRASLGAKGTPVDPNRWPVRLATPRAVIEALAPRLDRRDEVYLLSLSDLAGELLGADAAAVVNGDAASTDPLALPRLLLDAADSLGASGVAADGTRQLVTLLRIVVLGPAAFTPRTPAMVAPAADEAEGAGEDAGVDVMSDADAQMAYKGDPERAIDSLARAISELSDDERQLVDDIARRITDKALRTSAQRIALSGLA